MGIGEDADFRLPLGLVVLGGVVTSAFLTFYVVPAAFYLFERRNFEEGAGGSGEVSKIAQPESKPYSSRQPDLTTAPQTAHHNA